MAFCEYTDKRGGVRAGWGKREETGCALCCVYRREYMLCMLRIISRHCGLGSGELGLGRSGKASKEQGSKNKDDGITIMNIVMASSGSGIWTLERSAEGFSNHEIAMQSRIIRAWGLDSRCRTLVIPIALQFPLTLSLRQRSGGRLLPSGERRRRRN